ncbi:NUDIX hydrolase [Tessaracoccus rhinocerotis]|uniref:NUDIX hydrolase n=1 Tax=Tessaracoccus rhinocerotis TaxID=1689449 RepID=A0A553JYA6_9ACTN|nr:NUDIX hydrolase [Tessaracoccus rhinocerotis]TRY17429.1 NUDIX hydrolase [Tessaracoccus rhinocerotis]
MTDFRVHVDISGGVGRLRWDEQVVDSDTLQRAVSLASDDAILAHDLRRLQVDLLASDRAARSAVHRCGFRLEGILRSAQETPSGELVDVLVYARLAVDPVYGAEGFSGVMNSVLPTKRVIGHAVFRNEAGEVLLTETVYKEDWELPGGVVERGETPRQGAEREVLEEIGLAVTFGQPALVDWMPPYLGWDDAVEYIFDGGVLPDDVAAALLPTDREIRALHWVPRGEFTRRVTALSARRLELVLDGYRGMTENGLPVT